MGCPMFEKKVVLQRPVDYPFEELYRPWSWVLSSVTNLIIFAALVFLVYALIKRSRGKKRQKELSCYRRIVCSTEAAKEGRARVIVTGGSGCLGRKLIEELVEDGGYEVHSLDVVMPADEVCVPGVTSYIKADITNKDDVELAFKEVNPEAVFHVAGLIPMAKNTDADLYRVNQRGTEVIVAACRQYKVHRLLYTSTCDVVMSTEPNEVLKNIDETYPIPKCPLNAYVDSKGQGEGAVLGANGQDGILSCVLRCTTIGSPDTSICHALLHNRGVYIGDGSSQMTITSIADCAKAHILAEKSLRQEPISVASGQVYHVAGDAYKLKDLMEYGLDQESGLTIWGHAPPRKVSRWMISLAAYVNVLVARSTGWILVDPLFDVASVDFLCRTYTFNGDKLRRELDWSKKVPWQEVVEGVVAEHGNRHKKKTK